MKKRKDFEEFVRQFEEALDDIIGEIPEDRPVNIDVSIILCPRFLKSPDIIPQAGKTPVDIIETEKNVHTLIGIPCMEMETIKLTDSGTVLEITALSGDKAISERIELPARVNKKFTRSYRDGILEIVFNKPGKKAR